MSVESRYTKTPINQEAHGRSLTRYYLLVDFLDMLCALKLTRLEDTSSFQANRALSERNFYTGKIDVF